MNTTNAATRLIAGAIFATLISSLSAAAGAADGTGQKTVAYADLNLATTQGAAALYNRIRSASVGVCSSIEHGDLASKMLFNACTNKVLADAVTQVHQPALSAVYEAKSGRSLPMIASAQ